jgi:hypothetical protein
MTLFEDQAGAGNTAVFSDLYTISRQDGGLGDAPVAGDPTVQQATYQETGGQGATADRLNTLVNTDFGTPIVVTALNGGNDPYLGNDVTGNGQTYVDSSGASPVIRVVYDVSNCNGAGIFAFDTNGNQIAFPRAPLLYHELSHAFRDATNSTQPNDEIPAETDENVMRQELGLCLRDVNNHGGGCGAGDTCGGTTNGCFIVSAATGSPESVENVRLKLLRDRVVRATHVGAQLLDCIYLDYYRFSPRIAADLDRATDLRQSVLALAVRPLLAWYALIELMALDPENCSGVQLAAETVLRSLRPTVGDAETASMFDALRLGAPLADHAAPPFPYLASRLREVPSLPFASWAIFDPLVRMWRCAASRTSIVQEAEEWMTAAPFELLIAPTDAATLDRELGILARGPFGDKARRYDLGARLAQAWPDAGDALVRHDFVTQRGAK